MTTLSTNNSVFRGFFEKQKLTGPNFIDWYRQLRIVLSIDDKLNYLEQPHPPAPCSSCGGQNQGIGKQKHAFAPKPKIPPPPKREDPAKDSICHECGETGHWKRNCPQVTKLEAKEEKETQLLELVEVQGLRASRKLKPGALSLSNSVSPFVAKMDFIEPLRE
ncbi:zinc finger, CCHC-type containing protein [Tanacetum coccineum]